MSNRITTSAKYSQLVLDMQKNLLNYNKLTAQITSGSRLTSITDDPIASVNVLNTNRQLGQIETFQKNADMAMCELSALDDLMDLANGYLSSAWNRAVQANNQTYGKTSLEAMKVEIDEDIKTMIDLANTEYNNNYIFGGANTQLLPYEMDDQGNIIYRGTSQDNPDYVRKTEVADGVFETINTTGDKVFGWYKCPAQDDDGNSLFTYTDGRVVVKDAQTNKYTYQDDGSEFGLNGEDVKDLTAKEDYSGVFGALKKLSNSIQTVIDGIDKENNDLIKSGYTEMNATLDLFRDSQNTILTEQTKFGGVYNRLEMTTSTLETNSENLTEYLSQVQDIDLADAITKWIQSQYAYQASMQVSATTMNMSLLNYL